MPDPTQMKDVCVRRIRMKRLIAFLVLVVSGPAASGAWIPYYRMDSLAFLSSDIVLCDEVQYVKKTREGWGGQPYEYYEATVTVVQTLKGSLQPKQQIAVEIDTVYRREAVAKKEGSPKIPMGKALLFLKKEKETWRPVTGGVKPIIKGEAYCYGQFISNPEPLVLIRMAPENIDVPAATPYVEELLLKDLKLAIEKAKELKEAKRGYAVDNLIRKNPQTKQPGDKK
jgi:hypothetical protein